MDCWVVKLWIFQVNSKQDLVFSAIYPRTSTGYCRRHICWCRIYASSEKNNVRCVFAVTIQGKSQNSLCVIEFPGFNMPLHSSILIFVVMKMTSKLEILERVYFVLQFAVLKDCKLILIHTIDNGLTHFSMWDTPLTVVTTSIQFLYKIIYQFNSLRNLPVQKRWGPLSIRGNLDPVLKTNHTPICKTN